MLVTNVLRAARLLPSEPILARACFIIKEAKKYEVEDGSAKMTRTPPPDRRLHRSHQHFLIILRVSGKQDNCSACSAQV